MFRVQEAFSERIGRKNERYYEATDHTTSQARLRPIKWSLVDFHV